MKPFFAAGIETLVVLLVFAAISALTGWLKKKQQQNEPGSEPEIPDRPRPASAPGEPGPPPKSMNWEEELRRLLEGESAKPPPTRPPPLPELIPASPPPVRQAPPPLPVLVEVNEEDIGLPVKLPGLTQSVEVYEKASQIEHRVEEQLRRVSEQIVTHRAAPQTRTVATELMRVRSSLRDRESLRSAFVLSVVLGPPKALEQSAR